jgi:hypothetical protein
VNICVVGQTFVRVNGGIHLLADGGVHLELKFETFRQFKTRAREHGLIRRDFPLITDKLFVPVFHFVEIFLVRLVKNDAHERLQIRRARNPVRLDERAQCGVAFLDLRVKIIQDRLKTRPESCGKRTVSFG